MESEDVADFKPERGQGAVILNRRRKKEEVEDSIAFFSLKPNSDFYKKNVLLGLTFRLVPWTFHQKIFSAVWLSFKLNNLTSECFRASKGTSSCRSRL